MSGSRPTISTMLCAGTARSWVLNRAGRRTGSRRSQCQGCLGSGGWWRSRGPECGCTCSSGQGDRRRTRPRASRTHLVAGGHGTRCRGRRPATGHRRRPTHGPAAQRARGPHGVNVNDRTPLFQGPLGGVETMRRVRRTVAMSLTQGSTGCNPRFDSLPRRFQRRPVGFLCVAT